MSLRPANSSADPTSILRDPQAALQTLSWCGRGILTLLILGWAAWFYPFDDLVDRSGTPLGGDYVMLYVSGQTVLEGDVESLYDDARNQLRTSAQFPTMDATESWPFRYPPVTAWLMSGPARLGFGWSFATFAIVSACCVVVALGMLIRGLGIRGRRGALVFWSLAGWPVVGETILGGQTSPLALCLVVAGMLALRRQWDFVAGVLMGLCIYKPNIVGVLIIGTLVARPRTLWGMLAVAIPAGFISLQVAGVAGIQRYFDLAGSLATSTWALETPFWKVHGLAPMFDLLVPGGGKWLAFLSGIPVAVWLGLAWRKAEGARWWLAAAALLTANALFNPYVPIYDLLLVAPACLATTWYIAQKHALGLPQVLPALDGLVALWFFGPHVSQTLAPLVGFQFFPIVLTAILIFQIRELKPIPCASRAILADDVWAVHPQISRRRSHP
jgi:hypothetical protein